MKPTTDTTPATNRGISAAAACDLEIPPGPPMRWPGKQLTDIRDYNECCFRRCREKDPNGFYDDACGRACLCAVRARERHNGWNPCEHRLQPPVFWYEPYDDDASDSCSDAGSDADAEITVWYYSPRLAWGIFLFLFLMLLAVGVAASG